MIRAGVDTGGTFTDFVRLDENGRLSIHKELSTPDDPSRAVLTGLARLGIPEEAVVIHGSTVATNALLERRGARTALITTRGFADILEIGRQNRPELYALTPQKPPPLVPREWRFEVRERVAADGSVLEPLDLEALLPILESLAAGQIESAAICLLFSFLYPKHEQQIAAAVRAAYEAGGFEGSPFLSLSSEILPEYREYERTAATVINAYVAPLMARYLARLAEGIAPRRLTIMQSNGGVIGADTAGRQAVRTALSGPAGGVVGAHYLASAAGYEEIITFDMGGTSTDVALCPGRLPTTTEGEIAGLPLRLPLIDIHTVGAGGGSLAYVDAGGALRVGPQSAGAAPGPACYHEDYATWREAVGRILPSAEATTTDANLLLGRLDADHFLGGAMRLNIETARQALTALAIRLRVETPEAAAWGVIRLANANMERAVRRISVERGYDPRRFTLLAFGGGGPLHACELAAGLRIPRVLAPPVPGVLSALGMLVAAPTRDFSRTVMYTLEPEAGESLDRPDEQLRSLARQGIEAMVAEGHDPKRLSLRHALDMRYRGQSHELTVPYQPGAGSAAVCESFHAAHESRYGYRRPEAAIEIVTCRLTTTAAVAPPVLPESAHGPADAGAAGLGEKAIWFGERFAPARTYDRERLKPGNRLFGPALVFQYDTTTLIPPGWSAVVDRWANLVLSAG